MNTVQNNLHNQLAGPTSQVEYWCFVCEKEFSHANTGPAEVFCPQCGCISEMIDPSNDPRGFKPYDAQRESNHPNTTNPNPINNNIQQNVNTNPMQANQARPGGQNQQNRQRLRYRVVYQMVAAPNGTYTVQTVVPENVPQPRTTNRRNSDPQGNSVPQEQPMPSGFLNGMAGDPFSMMLESLLPGISMRGGFLDDLQSRIIEQFLRDDPNRHGAPPASQESISKLKESLYDPENCQIKDCSVCQEDYNKDDVVLTMPCNHTFHKTCLTTWLSLHNSCPSCRKGLNEESENNAPSQNN